MKNKIAPPLLLLMLLVCFPQLSETIYTPSLPNLANDFQISSNLAQWTLSIYFIGFAIGVAFWGNLSDQIGRRNTVLYGILIYLLACVGCFFTHSIIALLVYRSVQAFGASIGSVVVQSILRETFQGKTLNQVFSLVNISMALSPALGPLIGGTITKWFGWKSNFLLLFLMIGILAVFTYYHLPETNQNLGRKFSLSSYFSLTKQILSHRQVIFFALLIALFNGIMFSYYSEAPFIFINLIGITSSQYGVFGIIASLGVFLGSLISKKLNEFVHPLKIILYGTFLCLFAILLLNFDIFFLFKKYNSLIGNSLIILIPIFIFFIAFSLSIPNLFSMALVEFKQSIGTSSSIFGLFYYLLTAFFNFLMGFFSNRTIFPMPLYFMVLSCIIFVLFLIFLNRSEIKLHQTN